MKIGLKLWKKKEKQYKENSSHFRYSNEQREWAFSVLGLNENSSIKEIKDAYHKLCLVHHPDKFVKLGPEATRAANVIFTKINQAYNILVK